MSLGAWLCALVSRFSSRCSRQQSRGPHQQHHGCAVAAIEGGSQCQQHRADAICEQHAKCNRQWRGWALQQTRAGKRFCGWQGRAARAARVARPAVLPRGMQETHKRRRPAAAHATDRAQLTLGDSMKTAQIIMPAAPASSSTCMPWKSGSLAAGAGCRLASPAAELCGLCCACSRGCAHALHDSLEAMCRCRGGRVWGEVETSCRDHGRWAQAVAALDCVAEGPGVRNEAVAGENELTARRWQSVPLREGQQDSSKQAGEVSCSDTEPQTVVVCAVTCGMPHVPCARPAMPLPCSMGSWLLLEPCFPQLMLHEA